MPSNKCIQPTNLPPLRCGKSAAEKKKGVRSCLLPNIRPTPRPSLVEPNYETGEIEEVLAFTNLFASLSARSRVG